MKRLFPFFLFLFFLPSCVEVEPVSPLPEIRFKSFDFDYVYSEELDQSLYTRVLEFDFIDGDANLGVYDEVHSDSSLPVEYRFGIFIHFYEKVDTQYVERIFTQERFDSVKKDSSWVDTANVTHFKEYWEYISVLDTVLLHQQFPYSEKLDRVGQNKTVKGTVRIGILFPLALPYDTMRLEFYIRDRALNKSNVEVTNDFANEPINGTGGIQ